MGKALEVMADRIGVDRAEMYSVLYKTILPSRVSASEEQISVFLAVANEYNLNPITKEVYAYPKNGGGIQPVVSVDGWVKIMNSNPDFDGVEFIDTLSDDKSELISITCNIFKKSSSHPVSVTEYMSECKRGTIPWREFPRRLLRHKTISQCVRYAFGISGIIDPDEADRYKDAGVIVDSVCEQEADVDVRETPLPLYDDVKFDKFLPKWLSLIENGSNTAEQIIMKLSSNYLLTEEQESKINAGAAIQ